MPCEAMAEITARGKIPLLVGGTMLYYKALVEGLADMPAADPEVRAQIEEEAARLGWQALHDQLAVIDPVSAARIHPNDPQRLESSAGSLSCQRSEHDCATFATICAKY